MTDSLRIIQNTDGTWSVWDRRVCDVLAHRSGYATEEQAQAALEQEKICQRYVDSSRALGPDPDTGMFDPK